MQSRIADSLDALATWRGELDRAVAQLGRSLLEQDLLDDTDQALLSALRERLGSETLVLAFVAEFSRGKSELINAIFFSDAGQRVLPATPGRTTMCPVELRYDADAPPRLSLLPVETRLRGLSLAELRGRDEPWHHVPLDARDPRTLVQALAAVTRTQHVDRQRAVDLGFWSDERPEDNPPVDARGLVEVPTWRHAVINYPHPLLKRGLVVIDTPGLRTLRLDGDAKALDAVFDDIAALAARCRFRDCRHEDEPGCAVREAVPAARLKNFHKLQREARRDQATALERKAEVAQWKTRARSARARMAAKRG
jgi:hypothetical protein